MAQNTIFIGDVLSGIAACEKLASEFLGVGRESLASHPDFSVFRKPDGKNTMGVDVAREIVRRSLNQPLMAEKIVVVVSEFDLFTNEAQNCLLKTLEEGENVLFLATARNTAGVIDTVLSRVTTEQLHPLSREDFSKKVGQESELLYMLTQGFPERVDFAKEYIELFRNVEQAVSSGDLKEILKSLELLEETKKAYVLDRDKELYRMLFYLMKGIYEKKLKEGIQKGNREQINISVETLRKLTTGEKEMEHTKNALFLFLINTF